MSPLFLVTVIAAAAVWAKFEIEIEGGDGWAAKLPTWRIESHPLLTIFYGARPLTGYHAWAFSFILLVLHFPFAWTASWSWQGELKVLAAYAIFWITEDLLWFVFNPAFGLRGLTPKKAPWHKRWFLGWPVDYWIFTAFALGVLACA